MSRLLWCCLLLILWQPTPALAQRLLLQRLGSDAPAAEVLSGSRDAQLQPNAERYSRIREHARTPVWWRIRADRAIPADGYPQLQLESPYLTRVEAWVPGRREPTVHAIYGEDADLRVSTRALVIDLPQGLPAGGSVWLRVHARSSGPMPVSIVPLDVLRREDLAHAGWRAFILGSTGVLAVLALALWVRLRDPLYGFFTAKMSCVLLYLLATGGEARGVPLLGTLFALTVSPTGVLASLGTYFLLNFQRRHLDITRHHRRINRVLQPVTWVLLVLAALNLFAHSRPVAVATNLILIVAALLMFASCIVLALRGQRRAWALLVAWTPLLTFGVLRALQLIGWFDFGGDSPWIVHGLSLAMAMSCLLVTISLADQILELRRDRDRVRRLATVDGLTGALTRSAIEQRLQQEIDVARDRGTPVSVVFIDIDYFKHINDAHGHAAGDACLRQVVAGVRRRLRGTDALGRQGGDELLVVLPGAGLHDARRVAEDIREAVASSPLQLGDACRMCTLSMGVATLRVGEPVDALLQRADRALYASKAGGRNQVSLETGVVGAAVAAAV